MSTDKENNDPVEEAAESKDFIRTIIDEDIKNGKNGGKVLTRFPPEPNGYLHIGHTKAIVTNFSIASEYEGKCNLRFDDTNPEKEETEYVDSIKEDIKWLGFDWEDRLYYASDYFDKLYEYAIQLIKDKKAYVCHLTPEEVREYRGTLTEAGKNSPYRDRSVEENLELFEKMKNGEFKDGECTLRTKIDMASPNLNLRDPAIYRIKHAHHHRTGDKWCIYPMYDYTHCLSDALEGITHSLCSLEFENHRPLYDWYLDELKTKSHPQQIEFARLNITNVVMSKRKLRALVEGNHVNGWDDPRMPTIAGMRRKGVPSKAIVNFCKKVGLGKRENMVEMALFDFCVREELNITSPRIMGVLDPIKVVIDNYPEDKVEEVDAPYHPTDESYGTREVPFSKVLYIEKEDFMEEPPKKFFRLAPGREVRLRYGYFIKCESVVKDEAGNIVEVHCTYDPETKGGSAPDGRKVKATLHWVSEKHAIKAEARLYDVLFSKENPEEDENFIDNLNPHSLKTIECYVEPSLGTTKPGDKFQFERKGYFCTDIDSTSEKLIFNRTATLRDAWAKIQKKAKPKKAKKNKKEKKKT